MHRHDSTRRRGGGRQQAHELHRVRELLNLTCDVMPEAFAVCRAVRDPAGAPVAFRVEHVNAAFRRMLKRDHDPVGEDLPAVMPFAAVDWRGTSLAVLEKGLQVIACEHPYKKGRLCEVRCARAGPDRVTVLITDHSELSAKERLHAERLLELNHRTKNNLTIVAGLLRMQAARASEPVVREALAKAADRVVAVSDAHASLYRFGSDEVVDLGAFLVDLCERLGKAFADDGRISLEVEADSIPGPLQAVMALGLLVNEMVTNAAKYAYPGAMRGVIHVRLARTAQGMTITVSDQGRGLAAEFDPKSGGIGMQLIRSLARQLDGTIEIRRLHPGTVFEVHAPCPAIHGDHPQARLL